VNVGVTFLFGGATVFLLSKSSAPKNFFAQGRAATNKGVNFLKLIISETFFLFRMLIHSRVSLSLAKTLKGTH